MPHARLIEMAVSRVPLPEMTEAVYAYLWQGRLTDPFLRAVVSNDLAGTWLEATSRQRNSIPRWIVWCKRWLPTESFGSPGSVNLWCANRQFERAGEDA